MEFLRPEEWGVRLNGKLNGARNFGISEFLLVCAKSRQDEALSRAASFGFSFPRPAAAASAVSAADGAADGAAWSPQAAREHNLNRLLAARSPRRPRKKRKAAAEPSQAQGQRGSEAARQRGSEGARPERAPRCEERVAVLGLTRGAYEKAVQGLRKALEAGRHSDLLLLRIMFGPALG